MTSHSPVVPLCQPEETEDPLTAVLRSGARRLLAQAVEAEAEAFLATMKAMRLPDGRERLVRHGLGPERLVQTGIGPVPVRRGKLRDRGAGPEGGHEFDLQRGGGLAHGLGAVIGRAVPEHDQRLVRPLGPQPLQDIDGVLAVGAGIGPEPHLTLVVEVEAVERQLVGEARRMRGHPEAPAARRPAITKIGILMDVGLIEVDQPMPVLLGPGQQASDLLDKGLSALRVGSAEQFAGLLPRQLQAMQGAADRLAAAGATKRLLHPADQAPQGPAWCRVSPGERRRRRGVLGDTDDLAETDLDLWAKGGRPPVRRKLSASGPRVL